MCANLVGEQSCFWSIGMIVLAWVIWAIPVVAAGQDERSASPVNTTDRPTGRELLAQQIRIEQPDLKMEGKLILRTLSPLTGVLHLDQARGEPRQIFAGVMRLIPGTKHVFDRFFDQLDIHDLDLRGLVITVTPEGYQLQLASATIPEGVLKQVTGRLDFQKSWQLESGSLHLSNIPLRLDPPVPPMPFRYESVRASGERQEKYSVEIKKIMIGHLAAFVDPTGFFGDVLRGMGFAKGFKSVPIQFDRVAVTAVAEARQLVTQSLVLQTSAAKASGRASMAWQPEPRQVHLDLDVTAKNQPDSHFKGVIALDGQKK